MEYVTLNNGVKMPILGYGVYQVSNDECERCVLDAIEVGYRAIDTAQAYGNEEAVGRAIASCGLQREELFLTTKAKVRRLRHRRAAVLPKRPHPSRKKPGGHQRTRTAAHWWFTTPQPATRRTLQKPLPRQQAATYLNWNRRNRTVMMI